MCYLCNLDFATDEEDLQHILDEHPTYLIAGKYTD
jgi:hypothetical protein